MNRKKIFFLLLAPLLFSCRGKQPPVKIDATKNLEMEITGFNENTEATIEKNEIPYDKNDETMERLIDSFKYKIQPDSGLKNGDVVTVTVTYDKSIAELANAEVVNTKKDIRIDGLDGKKRERIVLKEKNQDGEDVLKSYDVIDDVKIPADWKMTEEEKQRYIEYMNDIKNNSENVDLHEDSGGNEDWKKGKSEKQTRRKSTSFMIDEYKDGISAFDAAEEYGKYSSQYYRIEKIMQDGKLTGYRCVFKGE